MGLLTRLTKYLNHFNFPAQSPPPDFRAEVVFMNRRHENGMNGKPPYHNCLFSHSNGAKPNHQQHSNGLFRKQNQATAANHSPTNNSNPMVHKFKTNSVSNNTTLTTMLTNGRLSSSIKSQTINNQHHHVHV